ncbi:hypothetical protein JOD43_000740 [Pullulanibacillus pueri]|uniref:UPF0736 protein n=1 Tax=Pullulanibacillus pueri TaxID=1437324 RepID=A0A8J3EPI4_9BACL|nr:YjbA family protein [Pullulanibacillus pueri]MBM7680578.1 hypothetical protein [Pullulanibacillus pueri]GGH88731.1 UPF0736 protein [Pullulanibacillus pueri]
MELIGDVWVNWFEGEENGYNVCEFHEWRKHDFIELLDQVPLIKVDKVLFEYIENDLRDLPEQLLEDIKNKSYIRKNSQREVIEYCFIATDGERHIVVDTLGYKVPIRKSRLIPRQEKHVLEKAETMKITTYKLKKNVEPKEYHILSPHPALMRGLTRKERQLKQILLMALDQLRSVGSLQEIRYWYTEWFPKQYHESRTMTFETAWNRLYDEIKWGWSEKHLDFCERMIKGQPYFEKVWELENGSKVSEKRII